MDGEIKIFEKDLEIARAILNRDVEVTMQFLYIDCYGMFNAFYKRYHTDCESCKELIDTIYVLIMTPGKMTKRPPLANFRGESSLKTWLRNATLTYCYSCFKKRINTVKISPSDDSCIDLDKFAGSSTIDMTELNRMDEEVIMKTVLKQMPNKRYSELLRLHIIEKKPHAEVAKIMGMTMSNYYNKRKLAKDQYEQVKMELSL